MLRIFLLLALLLSSLHAGAANFPRPAVLEPAVKFWTRVYTQVTTDQGYVHDAVNLSVVYETLDLPPYASNTERGSIVTQAKFRVVKALNAIARGKRSNLSGTEARVLAAWPKGTSAQAFAVVTSGNGASTLASVPGITLRLPRAMAFSAFTVRNLAWVTILPRSVLLA